MKLEVRYSGGKDLSRNVPGERVEKEQGCFDRNYGYVFKSLWKSTIISQFKNMILKELEDRYIE